MSRAARRYCSRTTKRQAGSLTGGERALALTLAAIRAPNPNRNPDQVSETLEAEGHVVSGKDGGRANFIDTLVYDAARNARPVQP